MERHSEIRGLGFEVSTAMAMKSSVFWDVTPYSPLEVNQIAFISSSALKSKPGKKPA
jgi:hypothetical protein